MTELATGGALQLFGHPLSSYTMKALIGLYETGAGFAFRMLDAAHPQNGAELARRWPVGKFPVLLDGAACVVEATAIIEHLAAFHPGGATLIPAEAGEAVGVRMLDRVFDNHVMAPMQAIVRAAIGPAGDAPAVAQARAALETIYPWLDARLAGQGWAAGAGFSLADAAAAPALLYAHWVHPIPAGLGGLRAYRARLLARPSMARCVAEARPYRALFPLGIPDEE